MGYNGTDTHFGRALAQVDPTAWSPDVTHAAWKMVRKYRGQLSGGGIDVDALTEPPAPEQEDGRRLRLVDFDDEHGVYVKIPYGDPAYPKGDLSARWNRERKFWVVPPRRYGDVEAFADLHGLTVSATARTALSALPEDASPLGVVDVADERFTVTFDYDPAAVTAVKEIPGRRWDPAERRWTAPFDAVRAVKAFAATHGLRLTDAADAVPDVEYDTSPRIDVVGGVFLISFPFDREMIGRVRDLPGARWNAARSGWEVDLEAAIEVSEFALATGARTGEDAQPVLTEARAAVARIAASAAHDADLEIDGLGGDLLPFQRAGVLYALRAMGYEPSDSGRWVPS